jgi:hypothetical protein
VVARRGRPAGGGGELAGRRHDAHGRRGDARGRDALEPDTEWPACLRVVDGKTAALFATAAAGTAVVAGRLRKRRPRSGPAARAWPRVPDPRRRAGLRATARAGARSG